MTSHWRTHGRSILSAAVLAAALTIATAAFAADAYGQATPPAAVTDPEAKGDPPAAVMLEGEPILWITAGAGPYSTQFRADRIGSRIEAVVHDRSIRDPTVTVIEA